MDIDDPTPPEALPCSVRTFVRPLDRFPPNFEAYASKNGKGVISPMPGERALLNSLLGVSQIQSYSRVIANVPLSSIHPQGGSRCDRWS